MLEPLEAGNLLSLPNIRHGFFTRVGGRSNGIYQELNCGFGSKDIPSLVAQNRTQVAQHLSPQAKQLVTVYQVHSARAIRLEKPANPDNLPKADSIVTTTPGLPIGVLTADCTPVLFADAQNGVIAAAHAGWRGAVGGILEATVETMEQAGAKRSSIMAALGPCIHQENYEVGYEFQNKLLALDSSNSRYFSRPEESSKPHFNLPGYVFTRLKALNIANVHSRTQCTYENDSLFYSYRRSQHLKEADYGRQISAIVLE